MRKMMVSSLFVVLAILASVIPANAQYGGYIPQTWEGAYYRIQGNNVQMLTADTLGLVNGLTDQLRRAGYRSLAQDIFWNGAAYGINTGRGFYQMYDRNRQPLSGRQRIERGAGIVAMADGARRIINNPRGAGGWIEAAVGAVLVNDSRYRGQSNNQRDNGTVVMPPSQGQGVYVGSDGIPVAVGTRPSMNRQEPVSNPPSTTGDWKVSNRTSKRAELWDGEQFIARIEPWQSVSVSAPENGYKAILLVPNRSGGLDQQVAQIREAKNDFKGWDIVAPAVP